MFGQPQAQRVRACLTARSFSIRSTRSAARAALSAGARNPRGPGLRLTQEALAAHGHAAQARAIAALRNKAAWSCYVVDLVRSLQAAMRDLSDIRKLRFLLYPSRLLPEHAAMIRADDAGVVWLAAVLTVQWSAPGGREGKPARELATDA
jgi:hypothetical protein